VYCSGTCRKAAYRRRRRAAFLATVAGQGTAVGDLAALEAADAAGELFALPPDPMDAVLACVVHARTSAAMFGAAGQRVSPALSLRCEAAADRIAAALKELLTP
jgi:hypothetical protein